MSALGERFGLLGGVPMMFINGDLHVDKSRGGRVLIVVWGHLPARLKIIPYVVCKAVPSAMNTTIEVTNSFRYRSTVSQ